MHGLIHRALIFGFVTGTRRLSETAVNADTPWPCHQQYRRRETVVTPDSRTDDHIIFFDYPLPDPVFEWATGMKIDVYEVVGSALGRKVGSFRVTDPELVSAHHYEIGAVRFG